MPSRARLEIATRPAWGRVRDAVTTRLLELRLYDRVFRACGFMGVFYDVHAHQFQLALTRAELRCANAIPAVYDRCVGRASGVAMWRGIVDDLQPARFVPCVAERLAGSATSATLFTDAVATGALATSALAACRVSAQPLEPAPALAGR